MPASLVIETKLQYEMLIRYSISECDFATSTGHFDCSSRIGLPVHSTEARDRPYAGRIHEGLTAEDVGKELPEVGRATIFRTLKLLVEAGVVCRLSLLNGAPKYSLSPIEDHHHTVCVKCGRIGEFRATEFGRLMKGIDRDIIGGIASRCIEINVTCDQCSTDGHR